MKNALPKTLRLLALIGLGWLTALTCTAEAVPSTPSEPTVEQLADCFHGDELRLPGVTIDLKGLQPADEFHAHDRATLQQRESELSREIEQFAGCGIHEIHNLYGTHAYRRYERRALEEALQIYPEVVIATPGGPACALGRIDRLAGGRDRRRTARAPRNPDARRSAAAGAPPR